VIHYKSTMKKMKVNKNMMMRKKNKSKTMMKSNQVILRDQGRNQSILIIIVQLELIIWNLIVMYAEKLYSVHLILRMKVKGSFLNKLKS
jgi:hypothetical protein